jgi:hypothetical protein
VAINSLKHVVNDRVPPFPHGCIPGSPFHFV